MSIPRNMIKMTFIADSRITLGHTINWHEKCRTRPCCASAYAFYGYLFLPLTDVCTHYNQSSMVKALFLNVQFFLFLKWLNGHYPKRCSQSIVRYLRDQSWVMTANVTLVLNGPFHLEELLFEVGNNVVNLFICNTVETFEQDELPSFIPGNYYCKNRGLPVLTFETLAMCWFMFTRVIRI